VRRTLANWGLFSLFVGLAAAGCSSSEKIRLTESGEADFHQLHIAYDSNSIGGLVAVSPKSTVQLAGLSETASADPVLPSKRVRLEVQYPYPGLHEEFVHVTLRTVDPASTANTEPRTTPLRGFSNANSRGGGLLSVTFGPPPTPPAKPPEECLVLDMPKSELTGIFLELAKDGYFKNPAVKDGASNLEVTYNEGQVEKVWNREAQLDHLVDMLKRYGVPETEPPKPTPPPGFYTGRNGKPSES
jgi:hypothetical protein